MMARRILAATLAAMILAVTPAQAVVLSDGGRDQAWANQSKLPTYPGRVTVSKKAPPDGYLGCTLIGGTAGDVQFTIEILRVIPARYQRETLYHELGHVFEVSVLTDRQRIAFARIWRLHPPPLDRVYSWWYGNTYDRRPSERFANVYELLAQYGYHAKFNEDVREALNVGPRQKGWALRSLKASYRLIAKASAAAHNGPQ